MGTSLKILDKNQPSPGLCGKYIEIQLNSIYICMCTGKTGSVTKMIYLEVALLPLKQDLVPGRYCLRFSEKGQGPHQWHLIWHLCSGYYLHLKMYINYQKPEYNTDHSQMITFWKRPIMVGYITVSRWTSKSVVSIKKFIAIQIILGYNPLIFEGIQHDSISANMDFAVDLAIVCCNISMTAANYHLLKETHNGEEQTHFYRVAAFLSCISIPLLTAFWPYSHIADNS